MKNMQKKTLSSEEETKTFAKEFLKNIKPKEQALVVALQGNLGAGKTTFSKGVIEALGVEEPVISPTFLIIKEYEPQNKEYGFTKVVHIDTYRLEDPQELNSLGLQEILEQPNTLVLIEWADRVKDLISREAIWVEFKHRDEQREVTVTMS